MATIKPFRAIRPNPEYVQQIAALPYDVYSREEARKVVEDNPLSFLRIDRAETNFPPEQDIYGQEVYEKAGSLLQEWIQNGYFTKEEKEGYYLYELTRNGHVQTGFVAVASVDDYQNRVILKHENTREEKEQDRIRHIKGCHAQTGPIYLAYRDEVSLDFLMEQIKQEPPLYDFTGKDGIRHRVFATFDEEIVKKIEEGFQKIDKIYIADGHHRCASAVKVCLEKRKQEKEWNPQTDINFFLSVLFPKSQLEILDYNRVVKDLNGLTKEEFLEKLGKEFIIEQNDGPVTGLLLHQYGMYLENKWYRLTFKDGNRVKEDAVARLDVSILQDYCLHPILGIEDPRTDKRIDFIGGIRGLEELERRVHSDCKVAFCLKATTMEELLQVADADMLMPPKSTWFEPKLRSGLFIHSFN